MTTTTKPSKKPKTDDKYDDLKAKYDRLKQQVQLIPKLVAQNRKLELQIRHIKSRHTSLYHDVERIKHMLRSKT